MTAKQRRTRKTQRRSQDDNDDDNDDDDEMLVTWRRTTAHTHTQTHRQACRQTPLSQTNRHFKASMYIGLRVVTHVPAVHVSARVQSAARWQYCCPVDDVSCQRSVASLTVTSVAFVTFCVTRAIHIFVTAITLTLTAVIITYTRTVVPECCKGDDQSQWRMANFDPVRHP